MIAQAIMGLLNANEDLTSAQNAQRNGFDERISNAKQNRLSLQQKPVIGGHIDLDSIINGVFTNNNQKNKSSIPSGYLGG